MSNRRQSRTAGQPAIPGAAEGVRYVFFPEKRRLLVEQDGKVTTYDTADHHITGVAQQDGPGKPLTFTTRKGPLKLKELS